MKQSLLYIPLILTISIPLVASDQKSDVKDELQKALNHYKASEFEQAIPGLKEAIINHIDPQNNRCRLAQCLAAQALKQNNQQLLQRSITLLNTTHVYNAAEGFGDTIMWAYYLKAINQQRREKGLYDIPLHLSGPQRFLRDILLRSDVSKDITTGELHPQHKTKTIVPFIGVVDPKLLFSNEDRSYLKPKPEAVTHWKNILDKHKGLKVATAFCSGTEPVLGGRVLDRNLPLAMTIECALKADANAHVFLVQGPPHHNIVTQSMFDKMSEEEKAKYKLNVIPDHYLPHVTQVTSPEGKEQHGSFEDTLALLSLGCLYIGCDTVVPHMAAHVGGKAIILLPQAKADGTHGRDWRWSERNADDKDGETTPWYSADKVRVAEVDLKNPRNIANIIALLTKK